MEERIISVGIKDIHRISDAVVYQDEDIVVISSVEAKGGAPALMRLDCFMIGTCIEGVLDVEIDYCHYRLYPGDTLFAPSNTIIGRPMLAPMGKLRFSAFSSRFLQNTLKMEKNTWKTMSLLKRHPVMRKGHHATPPILYYLSQVLTNELKGEPHFYHREVMRHSFAAFFCEVTGWLMKAFQKDFGTELPEITTTQTLHVAIRFAEMLSKDGGIHRSVKYYADALCYTPKHFAKLIKDACGRTPLSIITERVIDRIKYELQHSYKTIKEIADDFQFPNQSFFGKYVKKHTGMTPQELRGAGEEA